MVKNLIIVWVLGVVAFFVLWALLAKVVQRISKGKERGTATDEDADKKESVPESFPSED